MNRKTCFNSIFSSNYVFAVFKRFGSNCGYSPSEEENECIGELSERVGGYGEASLRFGYEVGYRDGSSENADDG